MSMQGREMEARALIQVNLMSVGYPDSLGESQRAQPYLCLQFFLKEITLNDGCISFM